MAEGKAFLASAQEYFVGAQSAGIADAHAHCERCEARLTVKGSHTRQLRSLFGRFTVRSPCVRFCTCLGKSSGASFSPLVGSTKVYSYVHNQVDSAASRLDQFLAGSGVHPRTRVTILTDGAGEFDKAAKGCAQPVCHFLDWFHIAMKFQAVERSLFGCKQIEASEHDDSTAVAKARARSPMGCLPNTPNCVAPTLARSLARRRS